MHEPLLRYIFRFTKDEAASLDVLQDVFLKLWEKRATLNVSVSVNAFLYTMARNRALNRIRDASRYAGEPLPAELPGPDPGPADAAARVSARELDGWFRTWVGELPPRRAEAFTLSRYHHLSHREIAEIMGLSMRTVDTHIVHALCYLRARYEALLARGVMS